MTSASMTASAELPNSAPPAPIFPNGGAAEFRGDR